LGVALLPIRAYPCHPWFNVFVNIRVFRGCNRCFQTKLATKRLQLSLMPSLIPPRDDELPLGGILNSRCRIADIRPSAQRAHEPLLWMNPPQKQKPFFRNSQCAIRIPQFW
jgi:hypothetical protein